MTFSVAESSDLERARRRIFLALFTALAVALNTVEVLLPSPVPWFRLGLANILTVTVLLLYGPRAAWAVTLGRIIVGSLLLGRLFSPGFFLSLGGGAAAVAVMTAAWKLCGARIGPVGISCLGAAAHAAGQMLLAWAILVRHDALWQLFPLLLLASLVTGVLNGAVADMLLETLKGHPAFAGLRDAGRKNSSR